MLKNMMVQRNNQSYLNIGWPFALLIIALFITVEALPLVYGAGYKAKWDWSFIYVTMRFVLLPAVCITHIIMNLFHIIRSEKVKFQILPFSSVSVSVGYLAFIYFHP